MHLKNIRLQNFRNFASQSIQFHPKFNLIVGKNAQGKTNLLESIYFLSHLKSFRPSHRDDLIQTPNPFSLIWAEVQKEAVTHEIKIQIEAHSRRVLLNGKTPHLYEDYYGFLPCLLFEPREVYLFRDSPSERRRTIARALFLEDPASLKTHREYENVVLQKNRLLKDGRSLHSQLPIWNEKQAQLGAEILYKRFEWIRKINQILGLEYQRISKNNQMLVLQYQSKWFEASCDIPKRFMEVLDQKKEEEIARRESLVGPHRDDWNATIDDKWVGVLGSQGENRSAIIALKSAQIRLFEETHGVSPIFLLDDVASELDQSRTEALFDYLKLAHGQVFLTTTEPSVKSSFQEGETYFVEEGKILSSPT